MSSIGSQAIVSLLPVMTMMLTLCSCSRSGSRSSSSGSSRSSSSSGSSSDSRSRSPSRSSSSSSRSRSSSGHRRRARSPSPKRVRKPSPSPRPTRIHIGRLTRNVTKDHVLEIFSTYGTIRNVDMPFDRIHPHLSRGFAYVEFEKAEDADKAIKYMDGGQIDGQEVSATPVLLPKPRPPFGGGPPLRRPPPNWRRSPIRGRRGPRYVHLT